MSQNEQSRCSQGTRTLTQPESANKHLFCRLKLNKYARETVSLRALQLAHLSTMFGPLQQQTQTEYGL